MNEPESFMDYWNAVDAAMLRLFGIDTYDAGIEPEDIAAAQEACQSADDYAQWFGEKYDLTPRSEWNWC
jgi:hypothetical protein